MKVTKRTEPPVPTNGKTIVTIELELEEAELLQTYLSHSSLPQIMEMVEVNAAKARPINELLYQIYDELDELGITHARN